jgi:hypothetical protein
MSALVLVAACLIPATPASAASNGLWSVYPTTMPFHDPRVFVEPELTPGKKYSDSITVANFTAAPLTFNLYGSAAFNTPGGGLSLRRRTDPQEDIGTWIKLPISILTVPAHAQTVVPFSITPPLGATPGDHVGGIVAEETRGTTAIEGSIPVTVLQAVAVRVYGRVRGPLHPGLSVRHTTMTLSRPVASEFGGPLSAHVTFTLTNSGNVVLTPHAELTVRTPFGKAADRSFDVGQLLPGNTLHYSFAFPSLTALGHLRTEVTVTAGQAKAQSSRSAWAVPFGLLAILVVLILILVILLVRFRRRRRAKRAQVVEPEDFHPRHAKAE